MLHTSFRPGILCHSDFRLALKCWPSSQIANLESVSYALRSKGAAWCWIVTFWLEAQDFQLQVGEGHAAPSLRAPQKKIRCL